MRDGVLIVSEYGNTIEVTVVNGELEVFGDVIVEEIESEDEVEGLIEFPEEPDMPKNSKAHLVDRDGHYPLIAELQL